MQYFVSIFSTFLPIYYLCFLCLMYNKLLIRTDKKIGVTYVTPINKLFNLQPSNYLPGKKGHTIGITTRDTIKHTITRPVPAFT